MMIPLMGWTLPSQSAWRALGGVGVHFGTNGWGDVDGKYGEWFDTLDARVVLIRPDFHVFGTSRGDAESTNVACRRPTAPRHTPKGLTMPYDKIDVHAHYIPEVYREALVAAGQDRPDGIPGLPEWNEETALTGMDTLGVRLAILSISSPGVHFGEAAAAVELARTVNEAGAQIVRAKPSRFGFFAALPLPEVDAAVTETRYALDKLGADGICLFTNHRGIYLGDERLEPVYTEVAARRSVVFVHPTSPLLPTGGPAFAAPMLEFIFETTRSITDLVLSGVLVRHPELRIIVPHAGAALPIVAGRVDLLAWVLANRPDGAELPNLRAALKTLHYDLAGAPVEEQLAALLEVADPSKLHYGSDFPFTPWQGCQYLAQQLQGSRCLDDAALGAIFRDNASELFRTADTPKRMES